MKLHVAAYLPKSAFLCFFFFREMVTAKENYVSYIHIQFKQTLFEVFFALTDILKTFAKTHYWDVRKMFLFVSHSNIVNAESYPCNTVGGPGFGRPCKFPCIYQQVGENSF